MFRYMHTPRSEYATKTDWRGAAARTATTGQRVSFSPSEWIGALESANAKAARKAAEESKVVTFKDGQLIFALAA